MPDDDQGSTPDRSAEARPMLRLALIAAVLTAICAGTSRALRSVGDPPPAALDGIATVLAVVSVVLLVTMFGSAVLWVLVRFLGPSS